jgi:uncharacterized protein (UPF0332 family)
MDVHGMDALSALEEARRILSRAFEELREGAAAGDALKVRDACEKGWLAAVKAVDALLLSYGLGEARTHADRRRKLRDLSGKAREVAELGIYDRVEARRSTLHSDGFYGGVLTREEVEEELRKVGELIDDVERLIKRRA